MSGESKTSQIADSAITGIKLAARWEDFRFPLAIGNIGGTITPPEFVIFRGGIAAYRFRNTRDDDVCFSIQFPHGWVPGVVKPHVHWSPGASGVAQSGKAVRWVLEYTVADIGTNYPATQTQDFNDTVSGADYRHETTPEGSIDLSAYSPSCVMLCRLYRFNTIVNNAAAGMYATDIDFHIQMQGIGTVNSEPPFGGR